MNQLTMRIPATSMPSSMTSKTMSPVKSNVLSMSLLSVTPSPSTHRHCSASSVAMTQVRNSLYTMSSTNNTSRTRLPTRLKVNKMLYIITEKHAGLNQNEEMKAFFQIGEIVRNMTGKV